MNAPSPQVRAVTGLLRAFALRDTDDVMSRVTEDVEVSAPTFIGGSDQRQGREGMREGLKEMERGLDERHERLRLTPQRLFTDESDPEAVVALCSITIIRENGESFGTDVAYFYRVEEGLISELRSHGTLEEALERLEDPAEVELP